MTDQHIKFVKPVTFRNVELIRQAIVKPMSIDDLAKVVPLAPKSIRRYISALRGKDEKEVFVSGFRKRQRTHGKNYPVPLYALGSKKDAVFKTSNKDDRNRVYLEKLKKDPERYDKYLRKIRMSRIKPRMQVELAYFLGRAA